MAASEYVDEMELDRRGILEDVWAQRQDEIGNRYYVEENLDHLESYVLEEYEDESVDDHLTLDRVERLRRLQPGVVRSVIENWMLTDEERIREILAPYAYKESLITLTLGGRDSWKTNTTWGLVERVMQLTGRDVYATSEISKIPGFANPVDTPEKAPEGCILVREELAVDDSARGSSTTEGRVRPAIMNTLRHKKQHLFGITQTAKITDNIWYETADAFLIKPLALTQSETDRGAFRRLLHTWGEMMPRKEWQTFSYSRFAPPRRFTMSVPKFFTEALSHTHDLIPSMPAAIRKATALRRGRVSWGQIASMMAPRGWGGSSRWWRTMVKRANGGLDPELEVR